MPDRSEQVFLRRSLAGGAIGPLTCVDAVSWQTPVGVGVRVYLASGSDAGALAQPESAGGVRLSGIERVGASLIATGLAEADGESFELPLGGGTVLLAAAKAESVLFSGLGVLAGQRFREPAARVADWLAYHVTEHGFDGAVIVDRAPPGGDREAFAAELEAAAARVPGLRRLVLLDGPAPLGALHRPGIGDPAAAPRADPSAAPEPDPWRAPLAEPTLYDILKWRFLSRAGVVAALDPCDLLAPLEDGVSVIEACRQSHTGVLPLAGRLVYPWRVRKDAVPGFGDHICRPFVDTPAPTKWCLAPGRAPASALWLPDRIEGLAPVADEGAAYDRCANIQFPESDVSELVQKKDLVEDATLIARAEASFGAKPVRPPAEAKPAEPTAAPQAPPTGRTVVVTCMKNEGPFILEWLAFHRAIGIDDFLIYTNDCTDGTDTLLNLLQNRGLVTRRDNPFRSTGTKPQHAALSAALEEPTIQNAGWILPIDVDEYVNIHVGEGRLEDLYAEIGEANAVSLTWRLFGNSDRDRFEEGFVTDQFTRCAPKLIRRPHQAWGFKTLFRNLGLFEGMGVHRPTKPVRASVEQIKWVNGSGKLMPQSFLRTGWRSGIDTYGYDLVTLNHYAVRSAESFLVKRDRGRVNHVNRDQGEAYWFRMNNNAEEDFTIQRQRARLTKAYGELVAMPEIAAAHEAAVAAHRARIAELRADPEYAALYERLTGERLKRLSRLHRHLGMNVFLRGPSSIPDRVLDPDLPANFFFNTTPPEGRPAE